MKFALINFILLFFALPKISAEQKFLQTRIQNDTCLMEVSSKFLERDILVSTTILQGSARENRSRDMRFGYGGDAVYDEVIRLVKDGDKLLIVKPLVFSRESDKSIFLEFNKSLVPPVIVSFPIKSEKKDSSYTIDVTNFLKQDNPLISLSGVKEELKLGGYDESRFSISSITSFPENINFKTYRTYMSANEKEDPSPTSWLVGTSWFLLPEKPMQVRIVDDRVGYFQSRIKGLQERDDVYKPLNVANRWRLEPKPEDLEAYKRGELVEPQKPIVYYIDRATPEYLVPYFIKAVEAWNPVFEKAGFKNAIRARLAPTTEEDSTYSEEDIRYSLISYKASPIPNAYGPIVTDPRSGEVLNSHVGIFHSVLELLQRWYFVMCSAVEPNARQYPLSQEVMGELASCVVTHEVGHTLGLLHNFRGSTIYSADSLRDVNFVRKNGIGSSIMDYERFNYLAQLGDGFTGADLMNRLGKYDYFAIEWGYRYFPETENATQVADTLKKWVDGKREKDSQLFFLYETDASDPRIQSEDCGSDQIIANSLCINNLKIIMSNLEKWNPTPDNGYYVLRKRYLSVLSHYETCMNHVLKFIGGRYTDGPAREETGSTLYKPVDAADQRRAVDFLCKNVFEEPKWLFDEAIMNKLGLNFDTYEKGPYTLLLGKLMLKQYKLNQNKSLDPSGYTPEELHDKLYQVFFGSKDFRKPLSRYERMFQSSFLTQLTIAAENQANFFNGSGALAKRIIAEINGYVKKAQLSSPNSVDAAHYKSLENFITIWETGSQKKLLSTNQQQN
ncbi:MAG: hypothetical protein H6Q14_2053 [Bacteroidetes bacterium]|nr:hypothetical protein [Bacteroidota bacterium]